jgi:hypothetical protein
LAGALFPDEEPGRFAAGLKEALAPVSAREAATVLDELGFARLDTTICEATTPDKAVGSLGTDISSPESGPPGVESEADTPNQPPALSPEEAIKSLLGSDASPPSPPVPEAIMGPSWTGGQSGSGNGKGSSTKQGRPVLRSYISSPDLNEDLGVRDGDEDEPERSPVDVAGVRHVLEYESACERIPTEMPHNNPGYDVESRNGSGEIVRYIEVKSFSGNWSNTYADLSRTQFYKANDLGALFWLYVVERADTDDYQIHRIQSPAVKANHFMLDDGWTALAES